MTMRQRLEALQAAGTVEGIIEDMRGRHGLGNQWDYIDEETQAEIRETWKTIVTEEAAPYRALIAQLEGALVAAHAGLDAMLTTPMRGRDADAAIGVGKNGHNEAAAALAAVRDATPPDAVD